MCLNWRAQTSKSPKRTEWPKEPNYNMSVALEGTLARTPHSDPVSQGQDSRAVVDQILVWLDEAKAEEIVTIDLEGKSSVGDFMVIASGRSARHVNAVADQLRRKLKDNGQGNIQIEGTENCDWVLLDTGDIIVHLFRPEVREFYNLEKMWQAEPPTDDTTH